jgi:hypothetical protein
MIMSTALKFGSKGTEVATLQKFLIQRGYPVVEDGLFDDETYMALRVFQSQNLDQHGQPLVVDGVAGPLTWWSLTHPKPQILTPSAVDYRKMPPTEAGGSSRGREALHAAIGELNANAGEIGGNNKGPFVHKYLHGIVPEGNPWCASFVSWCFSQIIGGIPFDYTVGARKMLQEFKAKGWGNKPGSGYAPVPGDIVVWWRDQLNSGNGHVGFVYQLKDGMLYTIEGNKSPNVQGFSYVFSRMDQLLGFGHVPEA